MERSLERIAALLAFVLASKAALAGAPTIVWCNACNDEQKQAAAFESDARTLVYVADVVTRSAMAFDVDAAPNASHGGRAAGAPAHAPLTPAQAEAIRTLADFHEALPKGWHKRSTLRYTHASTTAYSVARAGPEQRMLVDWMSRQTDVVAIDLLKRVAQSMPALSLHEKNAAPRLAYRVEFADGSWINAAFAFESGTPAFFVHSDPGQDSHRNPVLVEPSALAVQFDFDGRGNPNDEVDWRTHMTALGYSIADARPAGRWVCIPSGIGLRCTRP